MSKFDMKMEAWRDQQSRGTYPNDCQPLAERAATDYDNSKVTVDDLLREWGGDEPADEVWEANLGDGVRLLPEEVLSAFQNDPDKVIEEARKTFFRIRPYSGDARRWAELNWDALGINFDKGRSTQDEVFAWSADGNPDIEVANLLKARDLEFDMFQEDEAVPLREGKAPSRLDWVLGFNESNRDKIVKALLDAKCRIWVTPEPYTMMGIWLPIDNFNLVRKSSLLSYLKSKGVENLSPRSVWEPQQTRTRFTAADEVTSLREDSEDSVEYAAVDGAGKTLAAVKAETEDGARQLLLDRLRKKKKEMDIWQSAGERVVRQKVDPSPPVNTDNFMEDYENLTNAQIEEQLDRVMARSRYGEANFARFVAESNLPPHAKREVIDSRHADRRYVMLGEELTIGLRMPDNGWCLLGENKPNILTNQNKLRMPDQPPSAKADGPKQAEANRKRKD